MYRDQRSLTNGLVGQIHWYFLEFGFWDLGFGAYLQMWEFTPFEV